MSRVQWKAYAQRGGHHAPRGIASAHLGADLSHALDQNTPRLRTAPNWRMGGPILTLAAGRPLDVRHHSKEEAR